MQADGSDIWPIGDVFGASLHRPKLACEHVQEPGTILVAKFGQGVTGQVKDLLHPSINIDTSSKK